MRGVKRILFLCTAVALFCAPKTRADERPGVIFDMDTVQHRPGEFTKDNQKQPAGTAQLVDGKFGKAVRFDFVEGASGGFMTARAQATRAWDEADGFSFWVKGDGSQSWGGIELIDRDDFALRYGYCFAIDSTEWRKIVVPWRDVIPELTGPLVGARAGEYAPSKFGNFFFGKWFYWRQYPAESYTIDQVALEPKIPDEPEQKPKDGPLAANAPSAGLERFRAKLRQHQPVTIVTMGDSLTDEHHWSNQKTVWHRLLGAALEARYHGKVTVINPAIGGTTLSQNLVLMPRWAKEAPKPDLVTVWFGGNDWDTGVRGPRFREYLRLAVNRIRRQTHGSADVLLMTTCPTHAAWETRAEMEQAVRDVAKEKGVAVADVAAAFRKGRTPDEALRQEYLAWDKVHLGPKGHEVTRDAVLGAIEGSK
jgi:lysophospholipase L1-like esterase